MPKRRAPVFLSVAPSLLLAGISQVRRRRVSARPQPAYKRNHDWNRAICDSPRAEDRPDERDRNRYARQKWPDAWARRLFAVLRLGVQAVRNQHLRNIVANANNDWLIRFSIPLRLAPIHCCHIFADAVRWSRF